MRQLLGLALLSLVACSQNPPVATAPGELSAAEQAEGWRSLYDGSTLNGWEPRGGGTWIVEGGYITTVPGGTGGYLVTTEEFGDVRIRGEFWADETANGGIFLRAGATGDPSSTTGFEVNIFDAHEQWPTGSISGVQRVDGLDTVGRWVPFEITNRGNQVTVVMDGRQVASGEAERAPRGRIALQHFQGTGTIRYRNLRVLPL